MENYSYSVTNNSPVVNIISLVLLVIAVVGAWKVFVKAGIPGWHSLIPILNTYDICKIALRDPLHQACKILRQGQRIRRPHVLLQLYRHADSRLRRSGIPRTAIINRYHI